MVSEHRYSCDRALREVEGCDNARKLSFCCCCPSPVRITIRSASRSQLDSYSYASISVSVADPSNISTYLHSYPIHLPHPLFYFEFLLLFSSFSSSFLFSFRLFFFHPFPFLHYVFNSCRYLLPSTLRPRQ